MKKGLGKRNGWLWALAWLVLLIAGVDFYNWGRQPQLVLGLPLWLWQLFGLVLLIALVYGMLSRNAWGDE